MIRERRSFICWLTVLIVVGLTLGLTARADYPDLQGRVNDLAGVLSAGTKADLETRLAQFDQQTTDEVVVAIVPSLDGIDIDTYRNELFEKWALGKAERDNGILLVIGMQEQKIGIEVGYGLEGALTDATAGSIIRNEMAPYFKEGDYDAGVTAGVEAIMAATRGEYTATDSETSTGAGPSWSDWLIFLAIFGGLAILSAIFRRRGGRSGGAVWLGGGGGGFSGGGGSSGGGGASGGW